MSFIACVVLCLLSILQFALGTVPVVTGFSSQLKNYKVPLGEFNVAEYTLNMDQPLYLQDAVACASCNYSIASDCACDYASQGDGCGQGCPSCTDSCAGTWSTVQDDTYFTGTLTPGQTMHLRYYLNESCHALKFLFEPLDGKPKLYINVGGPASDTDFMWSDHGTSTADWWRVHTQVCPDNVNFELGTYYMAITSVIASQFRLKVRKVKLPDRSTITHTACTVPAAVQATHYCVPDDTLMELTCQNDTTYFVYKVTGCQKLSIALTTITGDVDLYISYNQSDTMPFIEHGSIESLYKGDDFAYISVCPPMGQVSMNLYITLDCYAPVDGSAIHTLLVTSQQTADTWKRIPLTSLPAYAAVSYLTNSIKLHTPSDTYECNAWPWTCKEFWAYSTAPNTLPIYPVPHSLVPFYKFMHLNVSADTAGVANTFKFLVLLNSTFPNFTKNFDASQLDTMSVELLPTLSNLAGEAPQSVYYSLHVAPPTTAAPMQSSTPVTDQADQGGSMANVKFSVMWMAVIAFMYSLF